MALSDIDARIKELEGELNKLEGGEVPSEIMEGFDILEEPITPFKPAQKANPASPFQQFKKGTMSVSDLPEGATAPEVDSMLAPDQDDSWFATKTKGAALLASQVGTILTDSVPLTLARMLRSGDETLADVGTLDHWITMNKEEQNASRVLTPEAREKTWLTMPVFGDISFGDIEDMSESFGYSIANGAVTAGGASAAASAGALMGVPAGPVGAVIGGVGGFISGVISSGSASKDAFIDDVKQRYLDRMAPDGNITPAMEKEWQGIYEDIKDDAVLYGAWEAAPETLGNILTFGIMKGGGKVTAPLLEKVKSDVMRKIGSGAMKMTAMYAEEAGTEVLTTKKQSEIEARRGLRDKPLNYGEAWDEVKAQVGLMTTLMGVGGAALVRKDSPRAVTSDSVTSQETLDLQSQLDEAKTGNDAAAIVEIQDALSRSVVNDESVAQEQIKTMGTAGSILDPSTPAGQMKVANDEAGLPSTLTGTVNEKSIKTKFQEISNQLAGEEDVNKTNLKQVAKQLSEETGEKINPDGLAKYIGEVAGGGVRIADNPVAIAAFKALQQRQEGPTVVEEPAPVASNKEQILKKLYSQRDNLSAKLQGLEGRRDFTDVPVDEKPALRNEIQKTREELGVVTNQVQNAEEFGGLVEENEAWRLLGLDPAQMQKRVLQDAGVSESEFQKRVAAEQAKIAETKAANQKLIARTLKNERRKKAVAAAGEQVKERQIEQQIAEEERAEEAAIVAEVTEEEAPARTRTPFEPAPTFREQDTTPAFERRVKKEQERIREEAPAPTTTDKRVFKGRMPEAPVKKPSLKPRRKLSQEERFLAKSEEGVIMSSGQKPYKSAESALRALRKLDVKAQKGYDVVEVKGGFGLKLRKDATDLRTRFSKAKYSIPKTKAESDLQLKKAKREVGEISKKLSKRTKGRVNIQVVKNPKELLNIPGGREVYQAIKAGGSIQDVRGVNIGDSVYIFTDRVDTSSITLPQLLLHELRHWSIGELMGDKTMNLLETFANDNMTEIEKRLSGYGLPVTSETIMQQAEEILIEQYKDGVKSNALDRIITAIRQFLRDVFGLDLAASDAEVKTFLSILDDNIKNERRAHLRQMRRNPFYNRDMKSTSTEEIDKYFEPQEADKGLMSELYDALFFANKQTELKFRDKAIAALVDKSYALKVKANQYEEKTGKATDAYKKTRIQSSTGSISQAISWDGTIEFVGEGTDSGWVSVNKDGEYKGYLKELQALGKHAKVFMRALQAERVLEEMSRDAAMNKKRAGQGKRPLVRMYYGKDVNDIEMVNGIMREAEIAKAAVGEKKWNRVRDAFVNATKAKLDLAQKAGVINAEERAQWERNIYVPLARELEKEYETFNTDRRGPTVMGALIKDGIKKLEGRAEKKVGDPLDNYIRNYNFMVNEAIRNIARRDAVSMLLELNDGSVELTNTPPSKRNRSVISVQVGGKQQYVKIKDDLVFDSLVDIPAWYTQHPVWKALIVGPKRILTGAITNFPAFWLTNFVRDAAQSVVLSGNLTPVDPIVGFFKALTNHSDFVAMKGSGGAFTGYDLLSATGAKAMAKQARGERGVIKTLWDGYRHIGSSVENAVRVQEFAKGRKKGGVVEGAFASRDLLDFAARGSLPLLHFIVSSVPFLNARLQGLSKVGRSYKADRAGFLKRGALLTAAALLLQGANEDDPRYKALPDYERFNYIHIFVGEEHYKLPMPFEVGTLFMSAPTAIKESLMNDEYGGARHLLNWAKFSADQTFGLNPLPQLAKVGVEQLMNKQFYTGRNIVPAGDLRKLPEFQKSQYTPYITKEMGKAIGWSPRRIEHFVNANTASLGKLMFAATDLMASSMGLTPQKPTDVDRVLDALGRSRFYSKKVKFTRYQQALDDIMPKAMQTVNTYAKLQKEKAFAEAIDLKSKSIKSFQREAILKPLRRTLSANGAAAKRIINSKMDIERKRQLLDQLTDRNLNLYKKAYERLGGRELL